MDFWDEDPLPPNDFMGTVEYQVDISKHQDTDIWLPLQPKKKEKTQGEVAIRILIN